MANPEHLKLLKQGVEHWNKWQEQNSTVSADLPSADLLKANLSGANLREADLRVTNLSGVNLVGADLAGANVEKARGLSGELSGAIFTQDQMRRKGVHPWQLIVERGKDILSNKES